MAREREDGADVSNDDDVRAWAAEVLRGGPPDLLVNNAATFIREAIARRHLPIPDR